MADFSEIIKELKKQGLFTEDGIEALSSALSEELAVSAPPKKDKIVLSEEHQELLHRCSEHRSEQHCCPHCGSTAVKKNGLHRGRQRYLCNTCHKTFGDTYGTGLYYSKWGPEKWTEFIIHLLHNHSLRTIHRDMKINVSTAWYNRHKVIEIIKEMDYQQDTFNSITEVDEYYCPLSYSGHRDASFFIHTLKRLPRHHRSYEQWLEYFEKNGLEVPANMEEEIKKDSPDGWKKSNAKSLLAQCKELNKLPESEKRKRGISNEQVCIMSCTDRSNNSYLCPACNGRIDKKKVASHLDGRLDEDVLLVTDSHPAYTGYSKDHHYHIEQIPSGKHSIGPFNMACINSFHSRFDSYMDHYGEVASKYLDRYSALFRFEDKNRDLSTQSKASIVLDLLTAQADGRIHIKQLRKKPLPFEVKEEKLDPFLVEELPF